MSLHFTLFCKGMICPYKIGISFNTHTELTESVSALRSRRI